MNGGRGVFQSRKRQYGRGRRREAWRTAKVPGTHTALQAGALLNLPTTLAGKPSSCHNSQMTALHQLPHCPGCPSSPPNMTDHRHFPKHHRCLCMCQFTRQPFLLSPLGKLLLIPQRPVQLPPPTGSLLPGSLSLHKPAQSFQRREERH
jgi:hypothetical protein